MIIPRTLSKMVAVAAMAALFITSALADERAVIPDEGHPFRICDAVGKKFCNESGIAPKAALLSDCYARKKQGKACHNAIPGAAGRMGRALQKLHGVSPDRWFINQEAIYCEPAPNEKHSYCAYPLNFPPEGAPALLFMYMTEEFASIHCSPPCGKAILQDRYDEYGRVLFDVFKGSVHAGDIVDPSSHR